MIFCDTEIKASRGSIHIVALTIKRIHFRNHPYLLSLYPPPIAHIMLVGFCSDTTLEW